MPNEIANLISDHGDKLDLLNLLSTDINGVTYLKMWCDVNNDQTNGPQYSARLNALNSQYDSLSSALWSDWIGDAVTVKAAMQKLLTALMTASSRSSRISIPRKRS